MRLRDIKDVSDLRDMTGDDVVDLLDELRAIAAKRGTELLQQGRVQARKAIGAPEPGWVGGAFLTGIALGAAVGAVVAVLMTPMAGREARQRLAREAEHMKERMPEARERLVREAEQMKEHLPEMRVGSNGGWPGGVSDEASASHRIEPEVKAASTR